MKKLLTILILAFLLSNKVYGDDAKIIFRNCYLEPNVKAGAIFTIDLKNGQVIEQHPKGDIYVWKINKIVGKSLTTQEPISLSNYSDFELDKYKRNFIWKYTFNLDDNTVSHSLELTPGADPTIVHMTQIAMLDGKLVKNKKDTCDVENLY